ncbi:hypothetical protein LG307_00390 [Sutcliffiella horikoshii]|uniref:hypothetical protein n=1 Tax=Sutcliffiella horikoshii TaxID=79883 RepID=UPI00384CD2C2
MLNILSKVVTGLVKEMGNGRVVEENVAERKQVGVLAASTGSMMMKKALHLAGNVGILMVKTASKSGNAGNRMRRTVTNLAANAHSMMAKELSKLPGMKELSVNGKEKNLVAMPNKAVGVKERIGQLFTLPIYLLAEFKFALSLSSKKEVIGVNTS